MKIFIVGGTGFIGYHTTIELLKRNHQVSALAIPDIKLGKWYPSEVSVHFSNIFEMSHKNLVDLFVGFDALVYAVGPDDRVHPKVPAYEYYYEKIALTTQKVCIAAREAGIQRGVILNSYFAYFDRVFPKKKLAINHPYIQCRIEQADYAIEAGGENLEVMILELPYIFGTMPENARIPIWKSVFIDRFKNWKIVVYPRGGSTMITVEHVAEAIAGALENGKKGKHYPIGDENISWKEMLEIMFSAYGTPKKILTLPRWIFLIVGRVRRWKFKIGKIYDGLDSYYLFKDILTDYFFMDPCDSIKELKYNTGGVREAIVKTIEACKNLE